MVFYILPHSASWAVLMIHDGSRKFEFIKRDETDFLVGQIVISISATAGKVRSKHYSVQNYNFEPVLNCAP